MYGFNIDDLNDSIHLNDNSPTTVHILEKSMNEIYIGRNYDSNTYCRQFDAQTAQVVQIATDT